MIEYVNTVDDLVAFTAFHVRTSREARRALRIGAFTIGIGCLVIVSGIGIAAGQGKANAVIIAVFAALGGTVGYRLFAVRSAVAHTRRLYSEGRNKGTVGWHRLLMTDTALREESEGGVTETKFDSLEKIRQSSTHVFVYVSAMNAHVIPRSAVSEGNLTEFVSQLKSRVAEAAV